MRQKGSTLLEAALTIALVLVLLAFGLPGLRAFSADAQLLGAAEVFRQEFRRARSQALASGRQTAIRFEQLAEAPAVSVYQDGNHNGVLAADIRAGLDRRVAGPRLLDPGGSAVRIAIHPGVPAPPPDAGMLDPADPIRFGRAEMLSFTPLGGATPGTFYLAGEGAQAAVRVNGQTGRVRVLLFRRGQWRER